MLLDRNNNHLHGSNLWGKYQTRIVAMNHYQGADKASGHAPGCLMGVFELVVPVQILDVEGTGKAVPKIMGGSRLKRLAIMHQALYGIGGLCSCKFLFFGLLTLDNRYGQHFLTEGGIGIEHPEGFPLCLLCRSMNSMPFLPQEFHGS